MKKRILSIVLAVVCFSGLLTGCAHEHVWADASCFSPETCISCGETVGEPLGHRWVDATETTPRMCTECGEMEAFQLPKTGQVFLGANLRRDSELTIEGGSDRSCYIKLKGTTGKDVFSFFVRAGESITVAVPKGYYYVYFSYGTEWYGPEYLFGDGTVYAKDDEICDFENYVWTYTLYTSANGNFTETPISADEF